MNLNDIGYELLEFFHKLPPGGQKALRDVAEGALNKEDPVRVLEEVARDLLFDKAMSKTLPAPDAKPGFLGGLFK